MENVLKIVKESGKKHIALSMPFEDLYNGIQNGIENGFINEQSHPEYPHLKVYKYSQSTVIDRQWNPYTMTSRGLILDTQAKEVVALPFIKFFNYDEVIRTTDIFTIDFVASEKMDGSMGTIFFYDNKWRIATMGSFTSEMAIYAQKYIDEKIDTSHLIKGNTYLTEIVYPENRIVIPYEKSAIYLLAVFTKDGIELDVDTLNDIAKKAGFDRPVIYDFKTLSEALELTKALDYTHEGYVIRFSNGARIKLKGDEYCRIHKLICRVTPLAIWEMMLNNDDMNKWKNDLPEEMRTDFIQIESLLTNALNQVLKDLADLHNRAKELSDKELGLELQKTNSFYFKGVKYPAVRNFIFSIRRGFFHKDFNLVGDLIRRKVFMQFRPDFNKLDGYIPSNAVNRFNSDN